MAKRRHNLSQTVLACSSGITILSISKCNWLLQSTLQLTRLSQHRRIHSYEKKHNRMVNTMSALPCHIGQQCREESIGSKLVFLFVNALKPGKILGPCYHLSLTSEYEQSTLVSGSSLLGTYCAVRLFTGTVGPLIPGFSNHRFDSPWVPTHGWRASKDLSDTTGRSFRLHPGGVLRWRETAWPLCTSEGLPEASETHFRFAEKPDVPLGSLQETFRSMGRSHTTSLFLRTSLDVTGRHFHSCEGFFF